MPAGALLEGATVTESAGVRRMTLPSVGKLKAFCHATQDLGSGHIYCSGVVGLKDGGALERESWLVLAIG